MYKYLFALLVLLTTISCSKNYTTTSYPEVAQDHKIVAVLPYEMVFSGRLPLGADESDILLQEEAESKAFQISLHNQLLNRTGLSKKDIKIEIQHFNKTNSLLEAEGISIRDSWEKSPEELSKILGVDALIRTRVEKQHYISDLASYGIKTAKKLLLLFAPKIWAMVQGTDIDKTDDIRINCSILNGADSRTLWNLSEAHEADWKNPANEVIEGINFKISKHFPYRETR